MKHFNHFANDTKENQKISMYATAHAGLLIARDRLIRLGGISQRIACNTKFSNECQRPCWVVLCNPIADRF